MLYACRLCGQLTTHAPNKPVVMACKLHPRLSMLLGEVNTTGKQEHPHQSAQTFRLTAVLPPNSYAVYCMTMSLLVLLLCPTEIKFM